LKKQRSLNLVGLTPVLNWDQRDLHVRLKVNFGLKLIFLFQEDYLKKEKKVLMSGKTQFPNFTQSSQMQLYLNNSNYFSNEIFKNF
jgi:hypothetical protein